MKGRPAGRTSASPAPSGDAPDLWPATAATGLLTYYLTSLIALAGVAFGGEFLQPAPHPLAGRRDLLATFANWDGEWYVRIAQGGYHYDPARASDVAFFPAFPLLGRWLAGLTGLRPDAALLIIAHVSLASTFVLLAAYCRQRRDAPDGLGTWTVLAFGLWPTTFFARMAYSESLFLLCVVAALFGMERRWPAVAIAVVCGLATATRSVGVCLLVPLALYIVRTSPHGRGRLLRLGLLPLACWGLIAFMAYQQWQFGDALAFARTQEYWRVRPAAPWTERLVDLLTLEPVRGVFDPAAPCSWQRPAAEVSPLFSLHLANPLYWLLALALLGVGIARRWLTAYEWTLALGLLAAPYLLRGHEMCMAGMGRFAAVAFPVYLVMGQVLARLPPGVAAGLLALSAFLLGAYAALFAAWYRFF